MTLSFRGSEILNLEFLGDAGKFSEQIFALVESAPLFSRITRDEAKLLSSGMRVYRVKKGTPFIAEGDPGDFMALLLEGEVEVIKHYASVAARLIAMVGRGKTLGEMSMIDGEPRFATCVASSETTLAVLTRESLMRLIEEHPALGAKILLQLIVLLNQRLRAASAKAVEALENR